MLRTSALIWQYYIFYQEPGVSRLHRVGRVSEDFLTATVRPIVQDTT